jgi:hypothetical protein
VSTENFFSLSPFPISNIEIRGLYIQSENDLVAAFIIVAPSNYKFYIANIDLFGGLVRYQETFYKFETNELKRVVFVSDSLYFGVNVGNLIYPYSSTT